MSYSRCVVHTENGLAMPLVISRWVSYTHTENNHEAFQRVTLTHLFLKATSKHSINKCQSAVYLATLPQQNKKSFLTLTRSQCQY